MFTPRFSGWLGLILLSISITTSSTAETFRVATYNLNNYFLNAGDSRPQKSVDSQNKIHENIIALKPDIIAVQEMSDETGLMHLQKELKRGGLNLPYHEIITGWDTNIHVAVLSKFPITARRPHLKDSYLLNGRRFHVSRGFLEVDITINPNYTLTLLTAHLKSKRPVPQADEADMRLEEARLLREKIEDRLKASPTANIIVVGDFNDTKNAPAIRALEGRGRTKLVDTRPAEPNGDNTPPAKKSYDPPNITWTYFYGVEDSYSRVDYIMISPGLAKEWKPDQTYVLAVPNWGLASDHRPLVATFEAQDR
jgi:endonuclease/exonuclease/phosphatase family metal-dependent hydrolase